MLSITFVAALLVHLSSGAVVIRQDLEPAATRNAPTVTHSHVHGLGLNDPSPTSDAILDKVDRKKWFRSYNTPPVDRPGTSLSSEWVDDSKFGSQLPTKVDWRDRYGVNWITTVQDQGRCGSCWAFSTTGLVESMIRIQHGAWSKRSEADLFEASSTTCNTGWFPGWALELIETDQFGLTDTKCNIYYDADRPFMGCGDRGGRTLRIGDYATLESHDDAKWWLANIGPVSCSLLVYEDFQTWTPDQGVYHHTSVAGEAPLGGHALLIVGYDDDLQAYIVKNSWGTDVGDKGYWLIGYGEVGIDDFQANPKYGVTNIDPDQFARRFHHNGNLYQSANGTTHRDFDVIRASSDGNLLRLKRTGEGKKRWSVQEAITVYDFPPNDATMNNVYNQTAAPVAGQPAILETSFGRQKELVYWVEETSTFAHWFYTDHWGDLNDVVNQIGGDIWLQTAPGAVTQVSQTEWYGNATGYPGFVQLDNSDFSVVLRTNDGSLTEYYRQKDNGAWVPVVPAIAPSGILQSGPALVQSNIGLNVYNVSSAGNVYVVAVLETGELGLYWRTPSGAWQEGEVFGEPFPDTPPVMIQDFWNTADENAHGGFQLLVTADDGWVEHWQRINDDILENPPVAGEQGRWELVSSFGDGDIAHVWGLVQGSYNFALEAIVEDLVGDLWHWQYTGVWERRKKLPSQY